MRDRYRHHRVTRDINRGTRHIEQPIHANNQRDALHRQPDLSENHRQHNQPNAGHRRRPNRRHRGSKNDHQIVCKDKVNVKVLRDEDGGHALHNRRAIHIDGRSQWNRKGSDAVIHA